MARLSKNALPSLRHHKASGQGVVTLSGRDFYLGDRSAPACEERYNALVARWISNGRKAIDLPRDRDDPDGGITVVELIAKYVEFAEARYTGRRATVLNVSRALSVLRTLFGREPVTNLGPKALRTYQRALVELPPQRFDNGASKREGPLARKTINYHTGVVKRMLKWAKNEELIPPSVFDAIRDVPWLRVGETRARETAPIRPVPDEIVEATIPFMPSTVADMIRLQRVTGMRPAELCAMTTRTIQTSGRVW
jgi:integrase